ncbi:MAG TPA: hypothetical protein VEJ63_07380 [Planctomycetota bacterium]|nr:hypothetical protein [Planctomycetota bacterium]
MQSLIRKNVMLVALIVMALSGTSASALAANANMEVQAVWANDKDKDGVPASLERYKKVLGEMKFSSFKDKGKQALKTAAGKSGSAAVGGYTVEVEVKSAGGDKASVTVSAKESGKDKPIGTPVAYTLTKGEPKQVFQLGDAKAPLIILITLDDVQ